MSGFGTVRSSLTAAVLAAATVFWVAAATVFSVAAATVFSVAAPAHAEPEPLYDLVDAATQRLQTADPVAAVKWLGGGSINDPARVQQVLAAVAADADSSGVPADFVTTAFVNQINATEAIQYSRFASWKLDPASAPLAAPDLSSSRAVIDSLNRRMVDQMAQEWAVLRSPDCATALEAAKTAVGAARGLDGLYRQALDSATRSYCAS